MIYCKLKGGLGNMLFQIAAMESLAKDNNDTVTYINFFQYCRFLDEDKFHNPEINYAESDYCNILNIEKEKLSPDIDYSKFQTYEVPFGYQKLKYIPDVIYDGFFQSEKYFHHNRQYLMNNVFKYFNSESNDFFDFVSIHVRRGDYLKCSEHHFVQPIKYYIDAMDYFDKKTTFIVYTNDIEWCYQNMPERYNVKYSLANKDYDDLLSGAKASHNIICNSSFSWWQQYFNNNPEKKIIAPVKENWFGSALKHLNVDDIYNEKWILK